MFSFPPEARLKINVTWVNGSSLGNHKGLLAPLHSKDNCLVNSELDKLQKKILKAFFFLSVFYIFSKKAAIDDLNLIINWFIINESNVHTHSP